MAEVVITKDSIELLRKDTREFVRAELLKRRDDGIFTDSCLLEVYLQLPTILEQFSSGYNLSVSLADQGLEKTLINGIVEEYRIKTNFNGDLIESLKVNGTLN